MDKVCQIPDCGGEHEARGWCNPHYQRWIKHGDPLAGNPTRTKVGEPFRYLQEVVLAYEGNECLPWPFARNSKGNGILKRDDKACVVSRIVCEAFNGPPPTPAHEAAHNCGNGDEACCTKRHLRWATHRENMADKVIHGTNNGRPRKLNS